MILAVQAYILFKANSGMDKEVSKQLAQLNEVQISSMTYGEYDVIAKVAVNDFSSAFFFVGESAASLRLDTVAYLRKNGR